MGMRQYNTERFKHHPRYLDEWARMWMSVGNPKASHYGSWVSKSDKEPASKLNADSVPMDLEVPKPKKSRFIPPNQKLLIL